MPYERDIEQAKFDPQDNLSPDVFLDRGSPLPDAYGEDYLVLLAKNPRWAFCFWELTSSKCNAISREHGPDVFSRSQMVLRIHDVTDLEFDGSRSNRSFDITVGPIDRKKFFDVGESDRYYLAELGLREDSGRWIPLLRSNTTLMPRGRVSDMVDEEWMIIEEDYSKLFDLFGRLGGASGQVTHLQGWGWKAFKTISSHIFLPSSRMPTSSGRPLIRVELPKVPGRQRSFWLAADCEVILHVATEPDAKVKVAGHPVALRPDGTISLRMPLPTGVIDLPVEAASADGKETRSIAISVERSTGPEVSREQ